MLAERRTVDERVGVELADGYCGSAVHALGAIGIEETFADAIYRLKLSNDPKSYKEAVKAVSSLAKHLDARNAWGIQGHGKLAEEVLNYWLCDICPSCTGKGAQAVLGTPMLGDACSSCNGSGKRAYPWSGRFGRYHTETLWALQAAEHRISMKMIEKLGPQLRIAIELKQRHIDANKTKTTIYSMQSVTDHNI